LTAGLTESAWDAAVACTMPGAAIPGQGSNWPRPGAGGPGLPGRPLPGAAAATSAGDQMTGIDPLIVEPCPGCDSQRTVPPMAPRRSAMLTKPCPDRALSALKPGPLSLTENRSPPDSSRIRTCALAFGACLAAFCRASRQQK